MTKMKKSLLLLLLFALLFAASLLTGYGAEKQAEDEVPDGNRYADASAETFSFGTLSSAAANQSALYVSGQTETEAKAENTDDSARKEDAVLVFTDGSYPKLHKLQIISGAFFSTESGLNNTDAVISTNLAVLLFKTLDGIPGRTFTVNGTELTVVGVYTADKSFFGCLSSDGQDRIYVPYYSRTAGKNLTVSEIYIRETDEEESVSTVSEEALDSGLGRKLALFHKTEYASEKALLRQRFRFALFFDGVAACVFLLVFLYRVLRKDALWLSDRVRRYESVTPWEVVKRCVLPLVLLAAVTLIAVGVSFPLYLPFTLTAESVLEPKTYWDFAVSEVQAYHRYGGYLYGHLLFTAALVQLLSGTLSLVFLLVLGVRAKRYIKGTAWWSKK